MSARRRSSRRSTRATRSTSSSLLGGKGADRATRKATQRATQKAARTAAQQLARELAQQTLRQSGRADRRAARSARPGRGRRGWSGPNNWTDAAEWGPDHAGPRVPRGGSRGRSLGYLPDDVARWCWQHKWQLAPLAGTTGVFAGASTAPVTTGVVLVGTSAAAFAWARDGRELAGRMWLSVRERTALATWAAMAGTWSLWAATPLPGAGNWLTLLGATAPAAWTWTRSRTVRPQLTLSEQAMAVVDRWTEAVALRGPSTLQGSRVLVRTLREPAEGAYTFTVQLADGVHGQDAATQAARRAVETQLRLPVGTAALAPDNDDATRLQVTLTPSRHLQANPPAWDGPVLNEDGTIPLADTPDGRVIPAGLFNPDGVEHGLIVGTSGAGKSSTTAALALPGPAAGIETLWYLDGKEGGSAPYLAPACDWYADDRATWPHVIDAAHAVLLERKRRRKGTSRWHTPTESDPILTLLIDEATTVAGVLKSAQHGKLLEILREGRSLGIRVIQVAQDPMGTDLIGGRKARDLMGAAGTVIAHRVGGSLAARIAVDSTSDRTLDLTGLPAEPGFVAIIRKGQVLAPLARVRFADTEPAAAAAAGIKPRPLTGPDATAAGTTYADRHSGQAALGQAPPTSSEAEASQRRLHVVPAPRDAEQAGAVEARGQAAARAARTARDVVADVLGNVDRPVSRGWIARRTGLAPATVTKALGELELEERARRAAGQRWEAVP